MRRTILYIAFVGLLFTGLFSIQAAAQTYSFSLDENIADFYIESDGSLRIDYALTFTNDGFADPIDFVDIGLPTKSYDLSCISASVDGKPIRSIETSPYVSPGVAIDLGSNAIPPGRSGTVYASIGCIRDFLFVADVENYVSTVLTPTWFDEEFVHGSTALTVSFHLPPGVKPDEGRWFDPPKDWPQSEPATRLDDEGRVLYVWQNPFGDGYTQYAFGVAFPEGYVPDEEVSKPTASDRLGISFAGLSAAFFNCLCFGGFGALFIGVIVLGIRNARKQKLAYLPPKISVEGHGIKRGLTAVEAAILLETPLDRVLTMILFGLIKKNAVKVTQEDPLKIEQLSPQPEDLRAYETAFMEAMDKPRKRDRDRALQAASIDLVKSIQKKMKGFSLKETREYYQSIAEKAWLQVEEAETPEVKSERYADDLEWTMLDDEFDERTKRTFQSGPVFVPMWWPAYMPSTSARPSSGGSSMPSVPSSGGGGRISLPTLPGSTFAASMVNGVQTTSGNLVSNVFDFTGGVTSTTNPPPKTNWSSGSSGGGGGCACACACAGCACACAGGGR